MLIFSSFSPFAVFKHLFSKTKAFECLLFCSLLYCYKFPASFFSFESKYFKLYIKKSPCKSWLRTAISFHNCVFFFFFTEFTQIFIQMYFLDFYPFSAIRINSFNSDEIKTIISHFNEFWKKNFEAFFSCKFTFVNFKWNFICLRIVMDRCLIFLK